MTAIAADAASEPSAAPRPIACMEVWGGHSVFAGAVSLPGNDVTLSCEPYNGDAQGGDIYYLSNCAAGIITRFVLADVAGHGAKVASLAATLRDLMRRHINTADQSRLARALSTAFGKASPDGRFATAILLTYFAPSDHLIVCNAGHPRPLWYRARMGTWQLLDNKNVTTEGLSNIPLGIAEPTTYDQMSVRLGSGDLVLIYTDSLIEAKGEDRRQLGEAGLLGVVRTLDPTRPETLISSLLEAIRGVAGTDFGDDVTALLLRPNSLKPKAGPLTALMAAWRISKSAVLSIFTREPAGLPQANVPNIGGAMIGRLNRK